MFMKNKKPRRQFFLKEWSLALSIFNIKARGMAHCLHWMKLGWNKVYEAFSSVLNLILLLCKKIIWRRGIFSFSRFTAILTAAALLLLLLLLQWWRRCRRRKRKEHSWLIVVSYLDYLSSLLLLSSCVCVVVCVVLSVIKFLFIYQ